MPLTILSPLPALILATLLLFTLHRTHLLMALLTLESTILLLTLFTGLLFGCANGPYFYLIAIILTLAACEASVGLALLVAMTRVYGSDLVSSLSINKC